MQELIAWITAAMGARSTCENVEEFDQLRFKQAYRLANMVKQPREIINVGT